MNKAEKVLLWMFIISIVALLLSSCKKVEDFQHYEWGTINIYTDKPVEMLTDGQILRDSAKTKIVKGGKIVTLICKGNFQGYQERIIDGKIVFEEYFKGKDKLTLRK